MDIVMETLTVNIKIHTPSMRGFGIRIKDMLIDNIISGISLIII